MWWIFGGAVPGQSIPARHPPIETGEQGATLSAVAP
jgi:hypothetical protein